MDQAGIQAKVARGFAIAARFLGSPYVQIRPTTATEPLTQPSFSTLQANFDQAAAFPLTGPAPWGKPTRFGLFDTTDVQAGDYFVGQPEPGLILFVASFLPMEPPLCIVCNRTVDLYQPAAPSQSGLSPYAGRTDGTDTLLASKWPVSLLTKTRGDADPTRLPSDVRAAYYEVLMPAIPGTTILPTMRLMDEVGNDYVITTAELSPYGWRLLVGVATT